MAAHTDPQTTIDFADLLYRISDEEESADLTIHDAAERGFLVPSGESIEVTDHESGTTYLVTVRKVVN